MTYGSGRQRIARMRVAVLVAAGAGLTGLAAWLHDYEHYVSVHHGGGVFASALVQPGWADPAAAASLAAGIALLVAALITFARTPRPTPPPKG